MAKFKSTITDKGSAVLTALVAQGKQLAVTAAAVGDGVANGGQAALTSLVHQLDGISTQMGEKEYVQGTPAYLKIPVQVSNAGLTAAQYIREVGIFARDEEGSPFLFCYSWLDGADTDNLLPPCAEAMTEQGDTVHIHDVAVVMTNQESGAITIEISTGSFVTGGQMEAYAAPKNHGHAAADILESTEESVEQAQRRQDEAIEAKANKAPNPTTGNLAALDAAGSLADSGKKPADFATASQGAKADAALPKTGGTMTGALVAANPAAGVLGVANQVYVAGDGAIGTQPNGTTVFRYEVV